MRSEGGLDLGLLQGDGLAAEVDQLIGPVGSGLLADCTLI